MSDYNESAPPYRKRCRCVECLLADKDANIEKLKESLGIEQDAYDLLAKDHAKLEAEIERLKADLDHQVFHYHKLCDENAKLKAERDEHRQSALNAIEGLRQERERTAKLQAVVDAAIRMDPKDRSRALNFCIAALEGAER